MNAEIQVHVVVAPVFGTNCCVVSARSAGTAERDCVIVDAGAGVADGVVRVVEEQGLRPRAVLATHGHVDHTWDAAALCERYGVPLCLHSGDAYRIDDPFGTLIGNEGDTGVSGALSEALAAMGFDPQKYRAPTPVEAFETPGGSAALAFGALTLRAVHAPGHTEGSTLYVLDADDAGVDGASSGVVLSGDVLFAGSIGRTDLPGGDGALMRVTLRDVVAHLDSGLGVVPGHGPTTTVRHELTTNPFLG